MWFSPWMTFILDIRFSLFMNPLHKQEMVRDVLNVCRMGHSVHLITEIPLHLNNLWWDFAWDRFHLPPLCPLWEVYLHSSSAEILVINHLTLYFWNSWASSNAHESTFSVFSLSRETGPLNVLLEVMSTGRISFIYVSGPLLFANANIQCGSIYNSHKYSLCSHLAKRNYPGVHRNGLREL